MARLRVMARGRCPFAVLVLFVALFVPGVLAQTAPAAAKRPMTFLDVQKMRQAGSPAPSPDGKLLLYTVSTPDWKEAKAQTDVYLVSIEKGVPSTRQMTFTKDKNETEPRWLKDSASFIFASNREAPSSAATQNQLYLMRVDGGEARKITDAKEGVTTFALSKDGKWLVYRSGKAGEEQLYRLPVDGIDLAVPEALTKQAAGVGAWKWAPDGQRIYFTGPETPDAGREGAAGEEVHRRHPQRGDPAREPVGGRHPTAQGDAAHQGLHDRRCRLSPSPPTASGWASAACRPTATSATSPNRTSTATRSC